MAKKGRIKMKKTYWMWYPGDFEIYHGMCQNFDREERGFFWPAYWKIASCCNQVKFTAEYHLERETNFRVNAKGRGHVAIKWERDDDDPEKLYVKNETRRYPFNKIIKCPARKVTIDIVVGNLNGLPCAYVEGDVIKSGKDWMVTDFAGEPLYVGWNDMYTCKNQNPMEFEYASEIRRPKSIERVNGGILYDFGREITAETIINYQNDIERITLTYGESRQEALDVRDAYLKHVIDNESEKDLLMGSFEDSNTYRTRLRAFRYIFIKEGHKADNINIKADYKYVDFPKRASFNSDDDLLNNIWKVSETTFRLASGIFFLDGIKRDRWIWSGDAYQSYFINQYLFFDKDICKRTILALRGKDPIEQHINTIVDYSMYWIISIENYYMMTGDIDFIKLIYPRMESMMRYCMKQLDDNGFIYGRKEDWIFVDWADIDKEGTNSAEQLLLVRCYESMITIRELLGFDTKEYEERAYSLKNNIWKYFWDNDRGAFIDSYISGKNKVSRHPNILAILFGYTNEAERNSIIDRVLLNDKIDPITTPYFKFYELEVLSMIGYHDKVLENIKSYWGGMLDKGATTFWEEYKPDEDEKSQYGMYGDPYGKSLCHAWGASPIYLIGRYFMGLKPTSPGYQTFEVAPQIGLFGDFQCELPINDGKIYIEYSNGRLTIQANKDGGILRIGRECIPIEKNIKISKEY